MNISQFIILIAIGIVAGFSSGTLGLGGGVIIIPSLIFFMGMTQHEAQGTSIGLLLPPIGILAFMNYYKEGYVNVKFALILAVAFILGAYLGSILAIEIPAKLLKKIFGFFLLFVAAKMIISK